MLSDTSAFSGFSVVNTEEAKQFYTEILGLTVEDMPMGLGLQTKGNNTIFVYEKADHTPASFTILNFSVEDIDSAIEALEAKGVVFEQYEDVGSGAGTDEKGVLRGLSAHMGPDIAWFKDPSGNVFSILQDA